MELIGGVKHIVAKEGLRGVYQVGKEGGREGGREGVHFNVEFIGGVKHIVAKEGLWGVYQVGREEGSKGRNKMKKVYATAAQDSHLPPSLPPSLSPLSGPGRHHHEARVESRAALHVLQ